MQRTKTLLRWVLFVDSYNSIATVKVKVKIKVEVKVKIKVKIKVIEIFYIAIQL